MDINTVKNKRKECINNEHFTFRILILLGVISYRVEYLGDNRFSKWKKCYKTRWYHPLTWIIFLSIFILSFPKLLIDAFKEMSVQFKEVEFYC